MDQYYKNQSARLKASRKRYDREVGAFAPDDYSRRVKDVYNLLNMEPRFVNEIIRWTSLAPSTVVRILSMLEERGEADSHIVDSRLVEAYPTISPSKWERYHLWFTEKSRGKLDWKKHRIRDISHIGGECSRMMERALQYAAFRVWGYEQVKASVFDSPKPDVRVDRDKVILEISVKWENPVDQKYLQRKVEHVPEPANEWTLVMFAPKLAYTGSDYLATIQADHEGGGESPRIEYHQFPESGVGQLGFPLFLQFREYLGMFKDVERDVKLVGFWECVDEIADMLEQYRGGE